VPRDLQKDQQGLIKIDRGSGLGGKVCPAWRESFSPGAAEDFSIYPVFPTWQHDCKKYKAQNGVCR
jgi:hypothetical protein